MATVEDVINAIEKNCNKIDELVSDNRKLAKSLKDRKDEDWDWVSVPTASKYWDVSLAKIYQRIHRGQLKTRKFDNKIYVSMADVKAISD